MNSKSDAVLLSGASGLIGGALAEHLQSQGADVRRLVRRAPRAEGEYLWDPYDGYIDEIALKGVDAVVHLSGAGIGARRWTDDRKRVLYQSRIVTTRFLAERLASLDDPPGVFVAQSAIGIYGDRGDEILTEESGPGPDDDFLVCVTKDWEEAAAPAAEAGIRVVHPRTGLVLSPEADLMRRLRPVFRAGLGGPLGSGEQWWSWITLEDTVRAFGHFMTSDLAGPVNLAASSPVRQQEFARALGAALSRPAAIPVPKLALKILLGGEQAESIAFSSTRVSVERLLGSGFQVRDDAIRPALVRMLS
jgi:uncharacterized protein